ncbi:hypothetical protein PVK06_044462 [Gossypium arboreum]|uniref:DRBM domain-containing protein n=1 Tax=Gossypium arboreum TaxID=29729 RepID=A0ABR0MR93_GOSAR|nr:hypothetical protein PVK06_044462 [Gossypium arboreum]
MMVQPQITKLPYNVASLIYKATSPLLQKDKRVLEKQIDIKEKENEEEEEEEEEEKTGEEKEEESEDEGTKKVKGSSILCLIGVEVVDSDLAQLSIDKVTEVDKSFLHENGKLDKDPVYNNPIEVDSHSEEPNKEEENGAFDPHFPKDVVNEWPAPKQIHSFHFIRYRFYEDPAIKAKLDQADKEIRKWNKASLSDWRSLGLIYTGIGGPSSAKKAKIEAQILAAEAVAKMGRG